MRKVSGRLLAAALLSSVSVSALAQTAPAAPAAAKPAEDAVEAITVTGAAGEVQSSIDRLSYSLGKDIAASSGSVADALRNVPAVAVDTQGVLTLRGDSNVTILIDGKPASQFEGQGRADALQQFPADQIERVEVITNPSAAMNPDGSGGIINLITKPSRGSGWTGSAYATAGSAGLKKAGLNFGYNSPKLNITGSLAGNYTHNKSRFEEVRSTVDPSTGLFRDHHIGFINHNLNRGPTARLTVGYALTPKDQLTGNASLTRNLGNGRAFNSFDDRDTAGAVASFQDYAGTRRNTWQDIGLSGGWRHSFVGEGHQLSVDVVRNRNRYEDRSLLTVLRASPARLPLERNDLFFNARHSELKIAYVRPMPGGAKLSAGYEFKADDNFYSADRVRGVTPDALIPDPTAAFRYDYDQTLNAAYATYEGAIGEVNMQAGLRIEEARLNIDEVSSPRFKPSYVRVYPSLHLSYRLDDERKLSASYATRVQRPNAFLLNPFRVYADPKTYQQGNPLLKPQDTEAFEAAYEQRRGQTYYLATAYYRVNTGEFSPIVRDPAGVGEFVVTFDNLGSSRTAGLELVTNGKLTSTLSYSANANLFWKEIDASNTGAAGKLSATGVSGRVSLDWQARPNDLLQVNASSQGKRLYAQGVADPSWTLNAGWRHKVNDTVTLTLSAQDLLDTNQNHRKFETPILRTEAYYTPVSRSISLRLDYRFGARPKAAREPGFEYEGGGAGGGGAPGL